MVLLTRKMLIDNIKYYESMGYVNLVRILQRELLDRIKRGVK